MKRTFIAAIILYPFFCTAQSVLLEKTIDANAILTSFPFGAPGKYSIMQLSEKDKLTRFVFSDSTLVKTYELRPEETGLSKINKLIPTKNIGYLAIEAFNEYLVESAYDSKRKKVFIYFSNTITGEAMEPVITELKANEEFVFTFYAENKYWVMTYLWYSNKFCLYSAPPGSAPVPHNFDIDLKKAEVNGKSYEFLKKKINHFSEVLKDAKTLGLIKLLQQDDIENTAGISKAYLSANSLYITLDNEYKYTTVWKIDLSNYELTMSKHEQPGISYNDYFDVSTTTTNSYITDSLLIQNGISRGSLYYNIKNLATGKIYYTNVVNKDNIHLYKNQKTFLSQPKKGGIETKEVSFEKLFSKVQENNINISAIKNGESLTISYGTAYFDNTIKIISTVLSLGFSAGYTYYINALPNTRGVGIVIFRGTKKNALIYTSETIDLKTMEKIQMSAADDVHSERNPVTKFIEAKKIEEKQAAWFVNGRRFFLVFIDKSTSKLMMKDF